MKSMTKTEIPKLLEEIEQFCKDKKVLSFSVASDFDKIVKETKRIRLLLCAIPETDVVIFKNDQTRSHIIY